MSIIYILIPLSIVLLIVAIWAFFWAVKSGQFDDMDSPALQILNDDDKLEPTYQKKASKRQKASAQETHSKKQ